jgi:hypothetical protein
MIGCGEVERGLPLARFRVCSLSGSLVMVGWIS